MYLLVFDLSIFWWAPHSEVSFAISCVGWWLDCAAEGGLAHRRRMLHSGKCGAGPAHAGSGVAWERSEGGFPCDRQWGRLGYIRRSQRAQDLHQSKTTHPLNNIDFTDRQRLGPPSLGLPGREDRRHRRCVGPNLGQHAGDGGAGGVRPEVARGPGLCERVARVATRRRGEREETGAVGIVACRQNVHLVGTVARVDAPEERRLQPPVGAIRVPAELVSPHAGHPGNPRGLEGQAQRATELVGKPEIDRQRRRPRGERVDDTHSDLVFDPQQQLAAPDGVVRVHR